MSKHGNVVLPMALKVSDLSCVNCRSDRGGVKGQPYLLLCEEPLGWWTLDYITSTAECDAEPWRHVHNMY